LFLRKKTYDSSGSLSKLAWIRFRRNRIAFSALAFTLIVAFLAIAGYWVTPDKTPMVNEQNLLLSTLKPGSKVNILKVCKNQDIPSRNIFFVLLFGQENKYTNYPFTKYSFSGDSITITEFRKDSSGVDISFHLADVCFALNENIKLQNNKGRIALTTFKGHKIKTTADELKKRIVARHLASKTFLIGPDKYCRDVFS